MFQRSTKKLRTHKDAFPWWEEKKSKGLKGFLKSLRPGLIFALAVGALLFVVEFNIPVASPTQQQATPRALSGGTPGQDTSPSQTANVPLPTSSLLGSLFGADAVDPLFRISDIVAPGQELATDTKTATGYAEPTKEPQRSIWRYLVAASDIGFENNESRLGLALATAEQGETDAINGLIADLEKKLLAYAALVPPTELAKAHNSSLTVLERYIAHLRASRDKTEGSVEKTWRSPQRAEIAEEASRVTQSIRDIVDKSGTILPPGVLP